MLYACRSIHHRTFRSNFLTDSIDRRVALTGTLLAIYDVQSAWVGVAVCLLALFWKRATPILRLIDWLSLNPAKVAVATVLAFALGSTALYHNYPLCMDEYAAVFQSKLFAAGRMFAQFPPNAAMLNMRVAALSKIWVWSVPCLLLFAALGLRRFADNKQIRLLSLSAALTFVAYLFVNLDQGHGWGYRYFHSAWGVLPILAACALSEKSERHSPQTAFAGAAAILSLLLVVPVQLSQVDGFIARHLKQVPAPKRPGNNVYFIQSGGFALGPSDRRVSSADDHSMPSFLIR
jgi:hypothetical protein